MEGVPGVRRINAYVLRVLIIVLYVCILLRLKLQREHTDMLAYNVSVSIPFMHIFSLQCSDP